MSLLRRALSGGVDATLRERMPGAILQGKSNSEDRRVAGWS